MSRPSRRRIFYRSGDHMRILDRCRPWLICMAVGLLVLTSARQVARGQAAPATQPSTAPAAAPVTEDPSGANGAGGSLLTPNPWLPGWAPGTTDDTTKVVTPKAKDLTSDDNVQLH